MDSHPQRRRRLAFALAALWLTVGWVNLARGARHAGGDAYRAWAFEHHAYSDVLALGGDRYLAGARPLPYLQDRIEYPPLLGVALWLPSWVPGGALGHFTATCVLLAACLAATLLALERIPGASPLWLAGTPALAYYAALNWDLLPIALLAVAILALERGRAGSAGGLAALGVSAKLFPAVLVPAAAAALAARRSRRALAAFGLSLAAALAAVNVPVALAAPDNFLWFWRFNAARGAENSVWDALRIGRGPLLEALSGGPLAASAAAAAFVAWRAERAGGDVRRAVRIGAALTLVVWIATNKVWSPQYALYGFLAGALAGAPGWAFAALTAISIADYHAAFEVRARGWPPGFTRWVFYPDALVRTAMWLALAAWLARELVRTVNAREARPPLRG